MALPNLYTRFRGKPLTLNDLLSIDRTIMANERSVLAYGRTALALVAMGGSCFVFFEAIYMQVVGGLMVIGGSVVMGRGWWRYRRMQAMLAAALEQLTGTPEHPLKEQMDADAEKEKEKEAKETPPDDG